MRNAECGMQNAGVADEAMPKPCVGRKITPSGGLPGPYDIEQIIKGRARPMCCK